MKGFPVTKLENQLYSLIFSLAAHKSLYGVVRARIRDPSSKASDLVSLGAERLKVHYSPWLAVSKIILWKIRYPTSFLPTLSPLLGPWHPRLLYHRPASHRIRPGD
jgi:hypothetical protein